MVNINNTQGASGSLHPALRVINDRGNHSYGTVAEFRIASTADTDRPSLLFSKGGTSNNWSLGMSVYDGNHDNFAIGYRSNYPISTWATSYLSIRTNGNVLIGTISDNGNRLRVNGTIFSDSSITATSFFESSDSRIKKLIENNLDYQSIANVTAKYYEKNGKQELGYFAQDFETLLPSAVSKNEDGYLNLSYREVHTAKIAYLEKRIEELEQQLKNKL